MKLRDVDGALNDRAIDGEAVDKGNMGDNED